MITQKHTIHQHNMFLWQHTMDETVDAIEDVTNNNNKKARLPSMRKLIKNTEFEGVRCGTLEFALSSGVACEHSEVKDAPTNP